MFQLRINYNMTRDQKSFGIFDLYNDEIISIYKITYTYPTSMDLLLL